jgi:hypothetical protein
MGIPFSSLDISLSMSAISKPEICFGMPLSSSMPIIRCPPEAFANEETSARNSFFCSSVLPTISRRFPEPHHQLIAGCPLCRFGQVAFYQVMS